MFCWRITKYNPDYRNKKGHYLLDAWTEHSDIGRSYDGKKATFLEHHELNADPEINT